MYMFQILLVWYLLLCRCAETRQLDTGAKAMSPRTYLGQRELYPLSSRLIQPWDAAWVRNLGLTRMMVRKDVHNMMPGRYWVTEQ